MDNREIRAMMAELAPVVREFVVVSMSPLLARLETLERQFSGMPTPRDGRDADPEIIRQMVSSAVAEIPPPRDGRDADAEIVRAIVAEEVDRAVATLPVPKDGEPGERGADGLVGERGADGAPGRDADPAEILRMVAESVAALPMPANGKDGRDGKDADPAVVAAIVDETVAKAVSHIPVQKGDKGDPGETGPVGRDGVGLAGAVIDRAGVLTLTLTDGTTRSLGPVVGKDGSPGAPGALGADGQPGAPGASGRDGSDADPDVVARIVNTAVEQAIAAIPVVKGDRGDAGDRGVPGEPGRDGRDGQPGVPGLMGEKGIDGVNGRNGIDGKDGLGFDDMTIEHDGERGLVLRFARGEQEKRFPVTIPAVLDRGVYKGDTEYQPGDAVTFGGSLFIAQEPTSEKPESGKGWRLAAKRGRDGKDGKNGDRGPPGPEGKPGKDR